MGSFMVEELLGVKIVTEDFPELFEKVYVMMNEGTQRPIVMACANPHALVVAQDVPVFYSALREFDIILPDGIGVVLAGKLLGLKISNRRTGPDFFEKFNVFMDKRGKWTYFLLGPSDNVMSLMVQKMELMFPNLKNVGMYAPPFVKGYFFPEEESKRMLEKVNSSGADILWVGFSAPKQEIWIYQNWDKLSVKFAGAVGAAFDFFAGTKKRSGKFFRAIGLEWLPRLLREPKRMWRRVFVSTPKFFALVLREMRSKK